MNMLAAFLAQGNIGGNLRQKATEIGLPSSNHKTILLIGVAVVIILALIVAAYLLGRKRERRHGRSPGPSLLSQIASQKNASATQGGRRRRRHRHREEHRPRNPTLAETGGLPPIRSDDPPPP